MKKLVSIKTRLYSVFFRRLLQEYTDSTTAIIGKRRFSAAEFPELIQDWCTNSRIQATRDFKLVRGHIELAGFHDSPDFNSADLSMLPFIKKLASEKIVRYEVTPTNDVKNLPSQDCP